MSRWLVGHDQNDNALAVAAADEADQSIAQTYHDDAWVHCLRRDISSDDDSDGSSFDGYDTSDTDDSDEDEGVADDEGVGDDEEYGPHRQRDRSVVLIHHALQ